MTERRRQDEDEVLVPTDAEVQPGYRPDEEPEEPEEPEDEDDGA